MANERQEIVYYRDITGNLVAVGDRVAAATNGSGVRVGEVLSMSGIYKDGIGYRHVRVKVRVELVGGGWVGQQWNPETQQIDPKPYIRTYDGDSVVKIGG